MPPPTKSNMLQRLLSASATPLNQSEDTADTLSSNHGIAQTGADVMSQFNCCLVCADSKLFYIG